MLYPGAFPWTLRRGHLICLAAVGGGLMPPTSKATEARAPDIAGPGSVRMAWMDSSLEPFLQVERSPVLWTPSRTGAMSAWWGHVPFAHWFVTALRPRVIVELGTHNGVSFTAFCEAVQRAALDCRCYAVDTWQGDEHSGRYGEDVFADLQPFVDRRFGTFAELMRMTFEDACPYFADGSIDLLHIDGLHTYEAVKSDFDTWLPKMSDRGIVLFHDINVRERHFGVWRLWAELRERYPSFEFLHGHGLGILATGHEIPEALQALRSFPDAGAQKIRAFFSQLGHRWILADAIDRQAVQIRQMEDPNNRLLQARPAWLAPILRTAYLASLERARPPNFEPSAATPERAELRSPTGPNGSLALPDAGPPAPRRRRKLMRALARLLPAKKASYAARLEKRAAKRNLSSGLAGLSDESVRRVREAFDPEYYYASYADVRAPGLDLLEHYLLYGWREGRNPSEDFVTNYYLNRWPDVRNAAINPFVHWVLHGKSEERRATPLDRAPTRETFRPKITAIIPNFNHARFLSTRIESVLCQTYENVEIIILDDCSTDDSCHVIDMYCAAYPDRIRAIFNERNSGNVFRQWRKGVEASTGELIWICESDDSAEPTFLQNLYMNFLDQSVMLAFGRILYIDGDGNFVDGLDSYREGAEAGIWGQRLVRPAAEWFANGFGVNNVIANVGGCLFRPGNLRPELWEDAQKYQVVGDWLLYTGIAAGGQIAWDPHAVSYFRSHGQNTSSQAMLKPGFYTELESFMLSLKRRWSIPDATVAKFHQKFVEQYNWLKVNESYGDISNYLSLDKLRRQGRTAPHILMSFYGFIPGGGELFPINLANALYARGWNVSMLAQTLLQLNSEMRAQLHPGIPVYDGEWVSEYGADRFLQEAGISLVHSHIVLSEYRFFEQWKMTAPVPYLSTLHGSYEVCDFPLDMLHRFAERVDHFVYTAKNNRLVLDGANLPSSRITKLPNAMPVDETPFPFTRADLNIAEDAVVFTLVARGMVSKGWDATITAFKQMQPLHPDQPMHLLLCGEGEETDRLKDLHGHDPDITFLGYQRHIHGLYRISDVALVPSRFAGESFPLCIIQALQASCPVIGTRVGEIEGMLIPEGRSPAGLVIAPEADDTVFTRDLRSAMETFLDRDFRQRHAGWAMEASLDYDMDKLAQTYGHIYERMIREKRQAT